MHGMEEIKRSADYKRQGGNIAPGDIITFGAYPQTAGGADNTPVKWRVLQHADGALFVLSEYIIDCKRYHPEFTGITWQNCGLRKWLNEAFYDAAFSASEKRQIITAFCTGNGENSPDTEDKAFLLSAAEVKAFTDTGDGNMKRRAAGTAFARAKKADGCSLYVYDKEVEKDYIVENGEKQGCSWWWLRTRLHESDSRAAFVGPRSSIRSYARVDLHRDGVRPALKIKWG